MNPARSEFQPLIQDLPSDTAFARLAEFAQELLARFGLGFTAYWLSDFPRRRHKAAARRFSRQRERPDFQSCGP